MHGKDKNQPGPGNLGKAVVTKLTNYTGLAGRHSETGLTTALNAAAATMLDSKINVVESQHKKELHVLQERRKSMESSMLAYSERMRQIAIARTNEPASKTQSKGGLLSLKFKSSNGGHRTEDGSIYRTKSLDFTHMVSPGLQKVSHDKLRNSENLSSHEVQSNTNTHEANFKRHAQLPAIKKGIKHASELGELTKFERENLDQNLPVDILISPPSADEFDPYPQIAPFPDIPNSENSESQEMHSFNSEKDYYKKERMTYVWKPQKTKTKVNNKRTEDVSASGRALNQVQSPKQNVQTPRVRKTSIKPVISHHLFKYSEAVNSFLLDTTNTNSTEKKRNGFNHGNGNIELEINTEFFQSVHKNKPSPPASDRHQLKGALSAPSLTTPASPPTPVNEEQTERRRVLSFSDSDRLHVFNSRLPVNTLHSNDS
ncbi:uncharacterized protein LOC106151112 [Lingula anatina]|uniref:Uncharacterized protein LOC106151112 n=1 Tax=Lingula anatina TaxID=7574 RepID=A0A1S3GXS5_LINAN|nr:uncharacterized protein LOC106151112 [Lingula anatina]XP_013379673.1 uncharacterized protein LOC106151112 [Lingula anatina]XP_013379680.1 uncharacterized protein LOC106151112 [Lingula anatina]XP_013379689.1 uncharacterized protein LOC106151112 [Lingula anatina]|eukprot:XP_013379666.1 uncharacterized protein LOC106151112 [Lingula anatina]